MFDAFPLYALDRLSLMLKTDDAKSRFQVENFNTADGSLNHITQDAAITLGAQGTPILVRVVYQTAAWPRSVAPITETIPLSYRCGDECMAL